MNDYRFLSLMNFFIVNVRQSKIMYGKSISLHRIAKRSENIHNKNNNKVSCIHIIIYEVIVIVMVVVAVQKPMIVNG